MASRTIKIACAAALLAPLAFVSPASAWTGPAENDCNEPYGAITDDPSPNRDCVGLDLKDGDDPNFPGNGVSYTVTVTIADGDLDDDADNADVFGPFQITCDNGTDKATSAPTYAPIDDQGTEDQLINVSPILNNGVTVAYNFSILDLDGFRPVGGVISLACQDTAAPAHS